MLKKVSVGKSITYQAILYFQNVKQKRLLSLLLLKSDSHLPNFVLIFTSNDSHFKNDEKCFLFHLKSSFRSQGISSE